MLKLLFPVPPRTRVSPPLVVPLLLTTLPLIDQPASRISVLPPPDRLMALAWGPLMRLVPWAPPAMEPLLVMVEAPRAEMPTPPLPPLPVTPPALPPMPPTIVPELVKQNDQG